MRRCRFVCAAAPCCSSCLPVCSMCCMYCGAAIALRCARYHGTCVFGPTLLPPSSASGCVLPAAAVMASLPQHVASSSFVSGTVIVVVTGPRDCPELVPFVCLASQVGRVRRWGQLLAGGGGTFPPFRAVSRVMLCPPCYALMVICCASECHALPLQTWQSEVLDSEFLVELVDSRTEGPRFKTFVSYNLVSTLCPTGVRRRFSDFEWLRELLKFRFHGACVCPFPRPPATFAHPRDRTPLASYAVVLLRGMSLSSPACRLCYLDVFISLPESVWLAARLQHNAGCLSRYG